MPKRKKFKSKKNKIKLEKKKFKLPFKLSEDQEFNLIFFGIIALGIILYYFGILGTIVNFILGAWVWWAVLFTVISGLIYWKEVIGTTVAVIIIIVVFSAAYGIYHNYTYKRCVDKFRLRPYTYDIQKFVDCRMISYSDTKGRSQDQVRQMMIRKYSEIKY